MSNFSFETCVTASSTSIPVASGGFSWGRTAGLETSEEGGGALLVTGEGLGEEGLKDTRAKAKRL